MSKERNPTNIQLYIYFNIPLYSKWNKNREFGQEVVELRNSLGFHENINYLFFGRNVGKRILLSSVFQTSHMTINFNMLGSLIKHRISNNRDDTLIVHNIREYKVKSDNSYQATDHATI